MEQALLGESATAGAFAAAAREELAAARGRGHNDFKIPLAERLITSALMEASGLESDANEGGAQ